MILRLSTYNVENLFSRPKIMLSATWAEGKPVLSAFQKLNELITKNVYSEGDKQAIADIIAQYAEGKSAEKFIAVQQVRGKLYAKTGKTISIKASGRNDWDGWAELISDDIHRDAVANTGSIITDYVKADVQCLVEVENRLTMNRFNKQFLDSTFGYNMVIDGNDDRGIDVGILSKFPITHIETHIFDSYLGKDKKPYTVFSRDCAIYDVQVNAQLTLTFLLNHLKSKGYGSPVANDAKRKRQADRVQEIYLDALKRNPFVVIAGDFNDTPQSKPLKGLLATKGLFDVLSPVTTSRGTFGTGKQQIDYLLVSPEMKKRFKGSGIIRAGIYAKSNKEMMKGLTAANSASDHAAVWADFDFS